MQQSKNDSRKTHYVSGDLGKTHLLFFISLRPPEPQIILFEPHRRIAVEYTGKRTHCRRQSRRHKYPRDQRRQLGADKTEQCQIAGSNSRIGVLSIITEDRQTDEVQQKHRRQSQTGTGKLSLDRLFHRAGRHQPLHGHLPHPGTQCTPDSCQQQRPEVQTDIGPERIKLFFSKTGKSVTVFKSILHSSPGSAFDQHTQSHHQSPHAEEHYKKLDKVGPNHRFHPSGTGVNDADDADHQNSYPAGPSGGGFKNLAGGQQHCSGVDHLAVSIADRPDKPGVFIIAERQIFKRCKGFDLEKELRKDHYRNHPDKRHDQTQHAPIQTVIINFPRAHYQRIGGKNRHQHRHRNRKIRHLAAAQQKVSSIVVAFGKIPPDRQHTDKINYDHSVIPPLQTKLIHKITPHLLILLIFCF